MGVNHGATRSMAGMPRGRSLYGSIPEQLADETSFLRQLQAILRVRSHYGIATSRQVDIPEVSHKGMLVLVHQLEDPGQHQLTMLNFANEDIAGTVRSEHLPPGSQVMDMFTGKPSARSTTCTASPWRCRATTACRCWSRRRPRLCTKPSDLNPQRLPGLGGPDGGCGLRQPEVVAQRGALVVGAEHAALLQQRHHLVDERVESARRDVRDEDEPVAGVGLHEVVDRLGDGARPSR